MREGIKPKSAKDAGPLPISVCPTCKYEMNAASCVQDGTAEPSAGDLSFCLNCGEILQFNEILVSKKITDAELASLDTETLAILSEAKRHILKRGRFK